MAGQQWCCGALHATAPAHTPGPPCHSHPLLQKLPRVDVGSLEEVIGRMEADEKGEWTDVVFVPAKSVAGVSPAAPAAKR